MRDLFEEINNAHEHYKRGLLTYGEMLNRIITLAEEEKSHVIEYKTAKGRTWKEFSDIYYSKSEAEAEITRLNNNTAGLVFRYRAVS